MEGARRAIRGCADPLAPHDFAIAHRGSSMVLPEHTEEAYATAIAHGAGSFLEMSAHPALLFAIERTTRTASA